LDAKLGFFSIITSVYWLFSIIRTGAFEVPVALGYPVQYLSALGTFKNSNRLKLGSLEFLFDKSSPHFPH
jgi:hypothetical protein